MTNRGRPLKFSIRENANHKFREHRIAVASRAMGIPRTYFGGDSRRSQAVLIGDALARTGLYPSCEQVFFRQSRAATDASRYGVYLLGAVGEGLVKVGFSADPESRIRNICQQVPFEIVTLAFILHAEMSREGLIHSGLAPWRKRGEWFYLTEESTRVIRSHFGEIDSRMLDAIGQRTNV